MKRVYKDKLSEQAIMELYDKQQQSLGAVFGEEYVDTRFGKTHILRVGNPIGKPLLFINGGNCTTPYYLTQYSYFFDAFNIFAVDIVGQPGKSGQKALKSGNSEYGEWILDVIDSLGFEKISCMGGSFGGGILLKLLSIARERVENAVLVVPSSISNIFPLSSVFRMGLPMSMYVLTHKTKWIEKAIIPLADDESRVNAPTVEMVKAAYEHVVIKVALPSALKRGQLSDLTVPVMLVAAQNDCLFPGEKIIMKAKKLKLNADMMLLPEQGHIFSLSEREADCIINFIKQS